MNKKKKKAWRENNQSQQTCSDINWNSTKKMKRLDLSIIITKTWGGKAKYYECLKNQSLLGWDISQALHSTDLNGTLDENYSAFCETIYRTCHNFVRTKSSESKFQKKNAYWFDSTNKEMQSFLLQRNIIF